MCKNMVNTWDLRKESDQFNESTTPTSMISVQDRTSTVLTYKERLFCGLKNGDLQVFVF